MQMEIVEMQSRTGVPTLGATMASADAIERKLKLTTKPICVVYAWVLIDVQGVDPAHITGTHLLPVVMYSHYVVSHETGRLVEGDTVLTDFATYIDPKGIFETAGVVYILLGAGFRKAATMDTVRAARKGRVFCAA